MMKDIINRLLNNSLIKSHLPFICLLLITIFIRLIIIISGKIPIDDDEAQHGLMAKHIFEFSKFYIYEIMNPSMVLL